MTTACKIFRKKNICKRANWRNEPGFTAIFKILLFIVQVQNYYITQLLIKYNVEEIITLIFEFRLFEFLARDRVKFCAKFYSIASQTFKKAKFKNLFHSDVPIRMWYALVLKFLENLEKCGLQMIQRKIFSHFLVIQGFPKIEKFWYFQIDRKCPKNDFKT